MANGLKNAASVRRLKIPSENNVKKIILNGQTFFFNDVHIAKKGDKAWNYAWEAAKAFGYEAPCIIESVPGEDGNEQLFIVDREDKLEAECTSIICSKERNEMFPSLTDDPRCMGFQFVYAGDELEID